MSQDETDRRLKSLEDELPHKAKNGANQWLKILTPLAVAVASAAVIVGQNIITAEKAYESSQQNQSSVNELKVKVDEIDHRLGTIEGRVSSLRNDFRELDNKLDGMIDQRKEWHGDIMRELKEED